jgi:hypothetical protein
MKKLFTAVPMKKLLIAASIVAMSSTAIAATDTQRNTDSTTSDSLTVDATFVKTLSVSLSLTAIDFGEVFTGATVQGVDVLATVSGENDEPFTFTIATSGSIVTLNDQTANLSDTLTLISGESQIGFRVNLDSSLITEAFVQETITTTVNYTAIAGTTTSPEPSAV